MRRVVARVVGGVVGVTVALTAGRSIRGAVTRATGALRLQPRDARLAAQAVRGMITAPGTASWVRARGNQALQALFPGQPGLLGDEQAAADAGDVIVVYTDQHVSSGVWSAPPGFTIPPARAAGVVVDAATGYAVTSAIWPENGAGVPRAATSGGRAADGSVSAGSASAGSVPGEEDPGESDPAQRWRQAMDRLGPVRTVRVDR